MVPSRNAFHAAVAAVLLVGLVGNAEPPPAGGKGAKEPRVVFRPVGGSKREFRVPARAAARLARIVAGPGADSELSPRAPRLAPDGTFLLGDVAYHFYAGPGILRRGLEGNRVRTWSDDTLKRLGTAVPRGGRWSQKAFDRWIAELEKPAGAGRKVRE
jgi:hypothetical protein